MAIALVILQTLLLLGALSLLGRLVVGLFNWPRRHDNPIYRLFGLLVAPLLWPLRRVLPRSWAAGASLPILAFVLLLLGYLLVGFWHRDVCLADLKQPGCERWLRARTGT
jgi:uncharacterized protein YggT (Ycf19 family)